jgi:AcrR family transcriptional regulator
MRPDSSTPVRDDQTFIEAARRRQIVDAAIETIAELGYARASLAEIARHAKISKSIISYHFETKDQLIRQVVEDIFAAGAQYMIPRVHAQATPRDALRAYVTSNVEFMAANRTQMIVIGEIASGFRDEDGMAKLKREELEPAARELEELLRVGQRSGEFRPFNTRVMAHAIRSAIDDIPAMIALYPDDDMNAYASEMAELFDRATCAEPTRRKR